MKTRFAVTSDLLAMILVTINAYDPTFGLVRFSQRYRPQISVRLDELMEGVVHQKEPLTWIERSLYIHRRWRE